MAANNVIHRSNGDIKEPVTATSTELTMTAASNLNPAAVTSLSKEDLDAFRRAIGAPPIFYETVNPKNPTPTSKLARKVPHGLYKTVLTMQKRANIRYYFIMCVFNCCIILQILLGATLTALSAVGAETSGKIGISTTVIASVNTVIAGLIALFHNAGLPGRLRSDMNEYSKVVEWIEFVMCSGVVDMGTTKDSIIKTAYDKYNTARATVENNQPDYYAGPRPGSTGSPPKDTRLDVSG